MWKGLFHVFSPAKLYSQSKAPFWNTEVLYLSEIKTVRVDLQQGGLLACHWLLSFLPFHRGLVMKASLECHNSLYPSNTQPLPNLRKCKSSVNKSEAAPLQFSPHSGGEGSISGESMVSLRLTHSKGSGEGGGEGVCACLQRPWYNMLNTTVPN